MKKWVIMYFLACLVFGMVLMSGCTSSQSSVSSTTSSSTIPSSKTVDTDQSSATNTVLGLVRIESVKATRDEYGFLVIKGIIVNDGQSKVWVRGYVDFYDQNGVKFDNSYISETIDAQGKSAFTKQSSAAKAYPVTTYKYHIDKVNSV